MDVKWRNGSPGLRRGTWIAHGYDWNYAVSDGRTSISLTVFSFEFSKRPDLTKEYQEGDRYYRGPRAVDISLHLPTGDATGTNCLLVEGLHCKVGYSASIWAEEFWDNFASDKHGFEQDESFWYAMENRYRELLESRAREFSLPAETI